MEKTVVFKVGDRVRDARFGDGTICCIDGDDGYPIRVLFNEHPEGSGESYTCDGKYFHIENEPSLFLICV